MPLSATPKDHALALLTNSTLRVEGGAGFIMRRSGGSRVILTAHHVVGESRRVRVVWPGGAGEVEVLCTDPDADVSVLSDRPGVPGEGLDLADQVETVAVGDPIWTAGFPKGWDEPLPVLSSGIIAGVGRETWLNLVGTWGNSGGAVAVKTADGLRVVGLVRGIGSRVHQDLDRALRDLRDVQSQLGAAFGRGGGVQIMGVDFGRYAQFTAKAIATVCELVEAHFRSGYVRVASLEDLRRALG